MSLKEDATWVTEHSHGSWMQCVVSNIISFIWKQLEKVYTFAIDGPEVIPLSARFPKSICTEIVAWDRSRPVFSNACVNEFSNLIKPNQWPVINTNIMLTSTNELPKDVVIKTSNLTRLTRHANLEISQKKSHKNVGFSISSHW